MTINRPRLSAQRYEGHGRLLCIEPKAFLEIFFLPEPPTENRIVGDAAIVEIRGPLDHHSGGWCDSYDSIRERVIAACDSAAKAVVLQVDSPGGDASGCFECARDLRALCEGAGKPLLAYVERACSGGYALASAASTITLADTATVGSIGVLSKRADYSAMNAARGVNIAFIASGARKADGHPDLPLTDAEIEAEQAIVDSMADLFFELVAAHRGTNTKAIAQLEARVLHGAAALKAGLADDIGNFGSVLARVASGQTATVRKTAMGKKMEEALAALSEIAQGDSGDKDAAAAALAAATAGGSDDAEEEEKDKEDKSDDDESTEDSDDDKESAEDADDDKSAEDSDDDEEKAAAASSGKAAKGKTRDIALEALAKVHTLEAQSAKRSAQDEKERLIASRKDFGKELRTALRKAPLSTVREMVKTLPRGPVTKAPKVEKTASAPTRGQDEKGNAQGTLGASSTNDPDIADMERRLGMPGGGAGKTVGVTRTPHKITFGTPATIKPKAPAPETNTPASN